MRQITGLCVVLLAIVGLSGCDKQSVKSDVVVGQMFDNLNAAMAYDEVCSDNAAVQSVNPNLFGNMQAIAYLFAQELAANHPELKPDDIKTMVNQRRDSVSEKAASTLREKGCDSDEAKKAKAALDQFLTISPPDTYAAIDAKVQSVGGTLHPVPKEGRDGIPAETPKAP